MIETNCKWCKKMKGLCLIHTGYDVSRKINRYRSGRDKKSGQG